MSTSPPLGVGNDAAYPRDAHLPISDADRSSGNPRTGKKRVIVPQPDQVVGLRIEVGPEKVLTQSRVPWRMRLLNELLPLLDLGGLKVPIPLDIDNHPDQRTARPPGPVCTMPETSPEITSSICPGLRNPKMSPYAYRNSSETQSAESLIRTPIRASS
jgi:hypothetical protein